MSAALTGIAAAVVGVIANLAVYFSLHTLFRASNEHTWGLIRLQLPDLHTVRPTSVLITAAALLLIFTFRWSVLRTLGAGAALGLAAGLRTSPELRIPCCSETCRAPSCLGARGLRPTAEYG